jgi:hypothetical protein
METCTSAAQTQPWVCISSGLRSSASADGCKMISGRGFWISFRNERRYPMEEGIVAEHEEFIYPISLLSIHVRTTSPGTSKTSTSSRRMSTNRNVHLAAGEASSATGTSLAASTSSMTDHTPLRKTTASSKVTRRTWQEDEVDEPNDKCLICYKWKLERDGGTAAPCGVDLVELSGNKRTSLRTESRLQQHATPDNIYHTNSPKTVLYALTDVTGYLSEEAVAQPQRLQDSRPRSPSLGFPLRPNSGAFFPTMRGHPHIPEAIPESRHYNPDSGQHPVGRHGGARAPAASLPTYAAHTPLLLQLFCPTCVDSFAPRPDPTPTERSCSATSKMPDSCLAKAVARLLPKDHTHLVAEESQNCLVLAVAIANDSQHTL